jgi:hypothetical protein
MSENDAGVAGLPEQLRRLFPRGKWLECPWKKGGRLIPIDADVASALLALIPNWAGDWNDFAPYLRRSGYTPEDLPRVTVKIISAVAAEQAQENMERRASRGLTIPAGVGTCTSTFTTFDTPDASNAEEEAVETLAKRILENDKTLAGVDEVLQALLERKAIGGKLLDSDVLAVAAIGASGGREKIRTILARTSALILTVSHSHRGGGVGLTALGEKVIRRVLGLRAMRPTVRLA